MPAPDTRRTSRRRRPGSAFQEKPDSRKTSGRAMTLEVQPPPRESIDLQFIYDTAPIGLAFLSPDCRYLQINQRLTEICGISVADHLGRTVREMVPNLAEQVEQ